MLLGAGGHARVVLEVLLADPTMEVIGAASDDGSGIDGLGVPMLGTTEDLASLATGHRLDAACVAIGDNAARVRVSDRWTTETGLPLASGVSPHAVVSSTARVGDGTVVFPGAVVNPATTLGRGVIVNTNASIDHDGHVGDFVHVAPGCAVAGGVTIGDRAFLGIGAVVTPGVTIGADAVVGAGAVVVDDVPAGTTVVGVPARPIQRREPS